MPGTILIVDDDSLLLELLQSVLTKDGYTIATALDGNAALTLLMNLTPDLIVLDQMMPGLDGFQVLDRIRANPDWAKIPVTMLTARKQMEDVLGARKLGVVDYIAKPIEVPEFVARIAKILARLRGETDQPVKLRTVDSSTVVYRQPGRPTVVHLSDDKKSGKD